MPSRRAAVWVAGLLLLGVAAALVPPVAVPAVVLTLIGALSFPGGTGPRVRRLGHVATAIAGLGATVGLGRFVVSNAMLGMVEGGQSNTAKTALYRLREVVIAEDALRRDAFWDPDHDGVGSALMLGQATGVTPLPSGTVLDAPVLRPRFRRMVPTPLGPASLVDDYLFIVCLPTPTGGFTAHPGAPVDTELSERRYVAYAWPSETAPGMNTAFFADEHERIRVLDPPRGAPAPYFGAERPPPCDAALGGSSAWQAWKGKKARERLPGDR